MTDGQNNQPDNKSSATQNNRPSKMNENQIVDCGECENKTTSRTGAETSICSTCRTHLLKTLQ